MLYMCAKSLQSCLTFGTLWTVACQALLSMGFPRQEHWSGLPCLPPGNHLTQGLKSCLLQLLNCRQIPYHWATGEAQQTCSVQFSSVQLLSRVWLCDPMNRSTPGLRVHHQLPEFTQTHVHRVSDAIQPSHPLSSPYPPAPSPSQHQNLFQGVNSSHEVAKVLEFQLRHHSLQKKSQGWSPSEWTGWISLQSNGLSRVFSNTTVQKHQFLGAQISSQSNSHIHTWPLEIPSPWLDGPLLAYVSIIPLDVNGLNAPTKRHRLAE